MPHKSYEGVRRLDGTTAVVVDGNGLNPRLDLRVHGTQGFEWGFGEGGAAQLALALLCDHFEDERRALRIYQHFKRKVVWRLASEGWKLASHEIEDAADKIEAVLRREERRQAGGDPPEDGG